MDKPKDRISPAPASREARLAQALRANLRRRKHPAPQKDPQAEAPNPHPQDQD